MDSQLGVGAPEGMNEGNVVGLFMLGEILGAEKLGESDGEFVGGLVHPWHEKTFDGKSHVHVGKPGNVNQPSLQVVLKVPQIMCIHNNHNMKSESHFQCTEFHP